MSAPSTHSNYPSGFPHGVTLRNVPILNTYSGKVFWVHSGSGSDGNKGTFDRPFASVDYAVGQCTANRGDVIMVKPGHAETFTAAAGIDADVAGIAIVGQGADADMPEFTFTTATTADIDVDAANITFRGLRFICGIDSQVNMIDVNSTGFTIEGCEFIESSATGLTCIDINGGGSGACSRANIRNNRFICTTAANWDRAIELGEVADHVLIEGNHIVGDFDDAGIHNVTGKVLTNLTIRNNFVRNNQAGQHAIELVSACTGTAYGNRLSSDAQLTAFDAGALVCMDNMWNVTTGGDTEGQSVNPPVGIEFSSLGRRVTKVGDVATQTDALFTVTGKCLITLMVGEVTSVIATTTSISLRTSSSDVQICISTDIITDLAGTLYLVTGDPDEALNGVTGGAANVDVAFSKSGHVAPFLMNDDGIDHNTDQVGTGLIQWDLYYVPLEAGAVITSAA